MAIARDSLQPAPVFSIRRHLKSISEYCGV
jgi:hypothetical protein